MSTTTPEPDMVKCSCPVCGTQKLPASAFRLVLCATDPDRSFYQFTCPQCVTLVTKQASMSVIDGLGARGVPLQRLPREALEPRGGAPLTMNDLLDFLVSLRDDATVAAAMVQLGGNDRGSL